MKSNTETAAANTTANARIRIAVCGFGNLGKSALQAARSAPDLLPVAVFTRRPTDRIQAGDDVAVCPISQLRLWRDRIDVLLLCGGSATDLPRQTPALAADFDIVNSFDTHRLIPAHFEAVDRVARANERLALISAGWDPGLFSVMRALFAAFLPDGETATFWGRGVSQGHSEAIRRIDGVLDARAYTIPKQDVIEAFRAGRQGAPSATDAHRRECFIVAEAQADRARIEQELRDMADYFQGYETTVTFVSQTELERDHKALPHGGLVLRNETDSGRSSARKQLALSLKTDSNPDLTAAILVACARAVFRIHRRGRVGCITPLDLAPADLLPLSPAEARRAFL